MKNKKTISKICSVKGCNGKRNGRHLRCSFHHKLYYGMKLNIGSKRNASKKVTLMSLQPCVKCGWKKSFVDRHRIDKSKGYTDENVIPLCPNCHRIETMKIKRLTKNKSRYII